MDKKILLTLFISVIITACQSSDDNNHIDYSNLQPLQTEVTLEIIESEEFLPAQLQGLAVDENGNILVADRGSQSISQFDSLGNFIATIAEGGNGPGELSEFFTIRNMGYDTLMVEESTSEREYFAKDDNGLYQFVHSYNPERMPFGNVETLNHKTDSTYYTLFTPRIRNMKQAAKSDVAYRNATLTETALSGQVVQDSLQYLKKGTRVVIPIKNRFGMFQVPYRFDDHLALLDEGFLIARPDSNAIFVYDDEGHPEQRIPFNVNPRPITDEDLDITLDYLPDYLSGDSMDKMESRIGETKPPYLDVWATDQIIWLQTSSILKDDKKLVLVDYNGNPIGKLTLENTKEIGAIRGNYIYTIHADPERENTIRKYEVQI